MKNLVRVGNVYIEELNLVVSTLLQHILVVTVPEAPQRLPLCHGVIE